eukprot:scaffold121877_cov55-Attheya_sp.AAC.1
MGWDSGNGNGSGNGGGGGVMAVSHLIQNANPANGYSTPSTPILHAYVRANVKVTTAAKATGRFVKVGNRYMT